MLSALLAERVEWVTGSREPVPVTRPEPVAGDITALVLLRSLDLADLVHGARRFAAGLAADEAATWRRSWTRTRFLFGNPANLTDGNPARVVAPAATAAWLGPFPDDHLPGLSRLLKPVAGELPELPAEVDVAGCGRPRVLRVAVGGLTLVDYLVHLHHTLAEAVLLGRLRPDEPVRLVHRPAVEAGLDPTGPGTRERPAYARVLPEPDGSLRLHTWLT